MYTYKVRGGCSVCTWNWKVILRALKAKIVLMLTLEKIVLTLLFWIEWWVKYMVLVTGSFGKQWGWSWVNCVHTVSVYSLFPQGRIVLRIHLFLVLHFFLFLSFFHFFASYTCHYFGIDRGRFTSDVKIKSISIVGGADGTSPSKMRAWVLLYSHINLKT